MDGPWEEVRVTNWGEFDDIVVDFEHRKWLFRGHSSAEWKLKTSLYRLFEDLQPIIKTRFKKTRKFAKDKHEELLIKRFQENAHLYNSHLPDEGERLEWLALMQHYGAPTRLLDVTLSPHIASYFALEAGHKDCAVFAFNHTELKAFDRSVFEGDQLASEIFKNRKGKESFIIPYGPKKTNERLVAQQGLFLVPSTNYEIFDDLLDYYALGASACRKIVIPADLRFEGVHRLRRMNISSATLFPGMDGFCRSLRFQVLESTKSQEVL